MIRIRRGPGAQVALFSVSLAMGVPAWPAAADEPVLGIDVSHHSGEIDWEAVAQHKYAFVYVKATEGVDAADPRFEEHWWRLKELGIPRGAYHFYVTEDDPEEQANFFLSRFQLEPGDLAPVVDIELLGAGTHGDLSQRLRRFLEIVEERTGETPIIYTNARFWNAHLESTFGSYPLWVAEYGVDEPTLPQGWETWHLWQFEGDVQVPGVEKGADQSRIHPDLTLDHLRVGHGSTRDG